MTSDSRRLLVPAGLFLAALVLGAGCDFSTKEWAEHALSDEPDGTITAIDPHVDLTLRYNPGTSFSIVQDLGIGRTVLGVLAFVITLVLFVVAVRAPEQPMQALAFGVIGGGAVGNGIDRIARHGVIDFIQVNYPWGGSWPTFNVADALVAIGVGLLLVSGWRSRAPAT